VLPLLHGWAGNVSGRVSKLVKVSEIRALVCFNPEDAPLPLSHYKSPRRRDPRPQPPAPHNNDSPPSLSTTHRRRSRPLHTYTARTAAGGAAIELYSIWLSQIVTTQVPKPLSRDFAMQELPQKDSIDAMPEGQALL
jgi:hypothetical protein